MWRESELVGNITCSRAHVLSRFLFSCGLFTPICIFSFFLYAGLNEQIFCCILSPCLFPTQMFFHHIYFFTTLLFAFSLIHVFVFNYLPPLFVMSSFIRISLSLALCNLVLLVSLVITHSLPFCHCVC